MFKFLKKVKKSLDDMNLKGEHRESIRKKCEVAERIISGESFYDDRRKNNVPIQLERRGA